MGTGDDEYMLGEILQASSTNTILAELKSRYLSCKPDRLSCLALWKDE